MVRLGERLRALLIGVTILSAVYLLALTPRAAAQNAAVQIPAPLAQYVDSLRTAQRILSASEEPGAVPRARAALAGITRVELPGGVTIAVSPLLGANGDELAPDAAHARIATLLAQLDAAKNDDTADRLAVLATVLTGPAFQQGESWWDLFRRWLAEWLDRLLPATASAPSSSPAAERAGELVAWGIGILAAIAIVLLLAYWLRGLIAGLVANAEIEEDGRLADDLPQTPIAARQRAVGAASAGDYRSAVRNLYLSALLTLEQHGLVPPDRSLTNREVLGRVGTSRPLRRHLQPVVETFDDVWYGVHEPDAGTYATYTHSIDELEALAQQTSKEAGP